MNEEFVKHRKAGLIILSKALDDICPTFHLEEEDDKQLRIKERVEFFEQSEVELDKEWEELEIEATAELADLIKERDSVFKNLEKTKNSDKVLNKITSFEKKKQSRVEYLQRKLDREASLMYKTISEATTITKKHTQAVAKLHTTIKSIAEKIKLNEVRYNTIIKNTLNSDNFERVQERMEQSKKIWDRKYKELEDKHTAREIIHHNKRMEFDQIRIALNGFVNEIDYFKHWCTVADVTMRECYVEAIRRTKMIGRDTKELEGALQKIISGV